MILENFNECHLEDAVKLALLAYGDECRAVPMLPEGDYRATFYAMISGMLGHGLGVVAIEDKKVVGFLTCLEPWDNLFGTSVGTFTPIHAHAAAKHEWGKIYSRLYQAASEKWVKKGVLSHAIALYAHDWEALNSFFWNGFGLRCIDAIRLVAPIECGDFPGCDIGELPFDEIERIVPLKNDLKKHLSHAPIFMPSSPRDAAQITEEGRNRRSRYFTVRRDDQVIAFIEISPSGENFVGGTPGMTNICGAYMLPEYRNSGLYAKLLSHLMDVLKSEGYTRCGVDFESFNPTAFGFWMKHFTAYTHSVVRRIDERIV